MDPIAQIAMQTYEDTALKKSNGAPSDKKTGARDGVDRSTVHRWRRQGNGPMKAVLAWIDGLDPRDAMRAVATIKVRGIVRKLRELPTERVIESYWVARDSECGYEADDRLLEAKPSTWAERALASERDIGADALKAACERIFDERGVPDSEVFAWRVS